MAREWLQQRRRLRRLVGSFRAVYVFSALVGLALRVAGWSSILLLLYVIADFFLAFSPTMLWRLNLALPLALIGCTIVAVVRRASLSLARAAVLADKASCDRRQRVLSALELTRKRAGEGSLWSYLATTAVDEAAERLRALRLRDRFPLLVLRRDLRLFVYGAGLAAAMLVAGWSITGPILGRIGDPDADIPPFSRYRFDVDPVQPDVIYGGSVEITADVSGAPVRGSVWIVTRHVGTTRARGWRRAWKGIRGAASRAERVSCFELSDGRYAQRLEQVVSPVEFCFATGRARSPWHGVDLHLQPKVALARLTVTPPAYCGRAPYAFMAGDNVLRDLRGSRIRLELTSNRPLSGGRLRVGDPKRVSDAVDIAADVSQPHVAAFEWTLERSDVISADLADIRGTRTQEPFRLKQEVRSDDPPEAVLLQPPAFSLATPRVSLPLAGYLRDDIGLTSGHLIRGLVGYRDRARPFSIELAAQSHEFDVGLDLADLGVEPGQVLEFYVEAMDNNPAMTGLAASDVVRIQVISEDEYAETVRMQVSVEEFLARFREAMQAVAAVEKALSEMEEALADDKLLEARGQDALDRLRDEVGRAQKELGALGEDFPVFDAEDELIEQSAAMAGDLNVFGAELGQVQPGDQQCRLVVEAMRRAFDPRREAIERASQSAETIAKIGRVMELSGQYQRLLLRQETLVRQLQRYADANDIPESVLTRLAREEEELEQELRRLQTKLRERADELPEEYEELKLSSLAFADALDEVEAIDLLGEAADAAGDLKGRGAKDSAELALERMRSLLSSCEGGFGQMARCDPKFSVQDPNMTCTLQQMLQSWRSGGAGKGPAGAAGGGLDGDPNDGYWMQGMSPLGMSVYGPTRRQYAPPAAGGAGADGRGAGAASGRLIPDNATEKMPEGDPVEIEQRAVEMERLPEKYRDAIRNYFGTEESD